MTINEFIEPTKPVSGSFNRVTGFVTNLIDKGIEYKILREENKLALREVEPANGKTSGQVMASKPDIGNGAAKAAENTNPVTSRENNFFATYGVPAIAIISGLIAIYAVTRRKGK
jgi:hypothetical protein